MTMISDWHNIVDSLHSENYPTDEYWDENGSFNIEVPLAGYKREDIELNVLEGKYLELTAEKQERKAGAKYLKTGIKKSRFIRRWVLNNMFDKEKISSSFENGILKISLVPSDDKKESVKKIEISS